MINEINSSKTSTKGPRADTRRNMLKTPPLNLSWVLALVDKAEKETEDSWIDVQDFDPVGKSSHIGTRVSEEVRTCPE
jgi:hypothetical protein